MPPCKSRLEKFLKRTYLRMLISGCRLSLHIAPNVPRYLKMLMASSDFPKRYANRMDSLKDRCSSSHCIMAAAGKLPYWRRNCTSRPLMLTLKITMQTQSSHCETSISSFADTFNVFSSRGAMTTASSKSSLVFHSNLSVDSNAKIGVQYTIKYSGTINCMVMDHKYTASALLHTPPCQAHPETLALFDSHLGPFYGKGQLLSLAKELIVIGPL